MHASRDIEFGPRIAIEAEGRSRTRGIIETFNTNGCRHCVDKAVRVAGHIVRTCRVEFNCCQVGCRGAGVETDWVSERGRYGAYRGDQRGYRRRGQGCWSSRVRYRKAETGQFLRS